MVMRDWMVAQIADRFHVLPSVVARDLDNDPERLSLQCLPLLAYAEAYRVYRRGNKAEIKRWSDSKVMELVTTNDFSIVSPQIERGEG
jgi:hypothetical protein